eukprot:TRINITY_DN41035_c0_g1_i1.p1 TRINITY_DN41035_c0_g1~~TRINITY_DN41035_c0_g1_i1.p1  ORF type:complete len:171 (+),score=37.51 TRINITY_DN41035_c0_g1_i1:1-513(+)
MERIVERLGKKSRGPPRPLSYKPKKEPEPVVAKRSEDQILHSMEMLSKGNSVSKAKKRRVVPAAAPGQVVKLKAPMEVEGKQLISGASGVVQEDAKSRKGYLLVKFNGIKDPLYVDSERLRLNKIDAPTKKDKKPKRITQSSVAMASTSPPRAYIFPDQWLEDEEGASSD